MEARFGTCQSNHADPALGANGTHEDDGSAHAVADEDRLLTRDLLVVLDLALETREVVIADLQVVEAQAVSAEGQSV
jgi:hypothetical protein